VADPVLVLQMQRMGDLVLTFPLLLWLKRQYPGHPVWVVAERFFFEGLMPLSPETTYFPWEAAERLKGRRYRLVLNLSHRLEAAELAGELRAEEHIGPVKPPGAPQHVFGRWQIYRANLVHNNRHNRFHWAELNALDAVTPGLIAQTVWPEPEAQATPQKQPRVGLFLGASQPEKRPHARFWADLAGDLFRRGLTPVLLGGPSEQALGAKVKGLAATPTVNLCGSFDLAGFTRSLRQLQLLVTPDTGPMHLAVWMGVPCLNLSMGPVSPWETGPYAPGHFVLQAAMSCVNCWHCAQQQPYRCRELFHPGRTAYLVHRLARGKQQGLERLQLGGMRLLRSSRNRLGLYHLQRLDKNPAGVRELAGVFWMEYFAMLHGLDHGQEASRAWQRLREACPALERPFAAAVQLLFQGLSRALRSGQALEADFWRRLPPLIRPLSGYLQMLLQNSDYNAAGCREALACLERLAALRS